MQKRADIQPGRTPDTDHVLAQGKTGGQHTAATRIQQIERLDDDFTNQMAKAAAANNVKTKE